MVVLSFPSQSSHPHPSNWPVENPQPPAGELSARPHGGGALRLLTTPEELAAAIQRAEAFERRNTEHLAARAHRHEAALAGLLHRDELGGRNEGHQPGRGA
jgi:hypothetical protein